MSDLNDQIKVKGGFFDSEQANEQNISKFYKEVATRKFCPVATIYDDENNLHVVTIDSPLPNSAQILDAIVIRFYLDSSNPLYPIKNKN